MCLQGNSCILSLTTKFSLQMAHSTSFPSLANSSSVNVITGSFATTSLLAGGTLGTAASLSSIFNRESKVILLLFPKAPK